MTVSIVYRGEQATLPHPALLAPPPGLASPLTDAFEIRLLPKNRKRWRNADDEENIQNNATNCIYKTRRQLTVRVRPTSTKQRDASCG